MPAYRPLLAMLLLLTQPVVSGVAEGVYSFDDRATDYGGELPVWFTPTLLELNDDLDQALAKGKAGLIVYFGQAHCAYCKSFMDQTLATPDLVEYLVRRFDIVGLSIHDHWELTAPDGESLSIAEFAARENAQFTPTLVFYGPNGVKLLTLRGFYPAYETRAALEYVADGHYRSLSFRDYLGWADPPPLFEGEKLIPDPLFTPPPFALDRSRFPASQPLIVIFEQPDCHSCDVLHSDPLKDPLVRERLGGFELVQLNPWDRSTPVITPDGRRSTPGDWAAELEIFYTPTLVFFDLHGREIFRIDSVIQFFRLAGALRYVAEGAYREHPVFQYWKYAVNPEEQRHYAGKPERHRPDAPR